MSPTLEDHPVFPIELDFDNNDGVDGGSTLSFCTALKSAVITPNPKDCYQQIFKKNYASKYPCIERKDSGDRAQGKQRKSCCNNFDIERD